MVVMGTISDAKKHLADRFRREDGFVGVGTFRSANEEGIRVYVADARFPCRGSARSYVVLRGVSADGRSVRFGPSSRSLRPHFSAALSDILLTDQSRTGFM